MKCPDCRKSYKRYGWFVRHDESNHYPQNTSGYNRCHFCLKTTEFPIIGNFFLQDYPSYCPRGELGETACDDCYKIWWCSQDGHKKLKNPIK